MEMQRLISQIRAKNAHAQARSSHLAQLVSRLRMNVATCAQIVVQVGGYSSL
jgi:hypothetical protein